MLPVLSGTTSEARGPRSRHMTKDGKDKQAEQAERGGFEIQKKARQIDIMNPVER